MRTSPRLWIQGLLIGALLATHTGVVAAQIPTPTPIDTGVNLSPTPVPTTDPAVQEAIDTVTDTVTDTIDTAEETVNNVEDTAEETTDPVRTSKDPVGTVKDAAAGSSSGASDTVDAVTGATTQKEAGGGATGTSPYANSGAGGTTGRAYTAAIAGSLQNWVKARGLFNSAALLAGAQPSLAILVDAMNDADGDGIFSDSENAPEPRTDVTFKALVTNIGSTNFEIAGVSHTYAGATGPTQAKVCAELTGIMLAPGESLACSFPVSDYAPARGESLVNTLMAAGFEVGKGARRGASDSDSTTVETLVTGDEVLAVAIKRNLAFTGTEAARLLALGLVLLAMGGALISLARARSRRHTRPLPSKPSAELLGWWTAQPAKRQMKEKSHQK
jgi:hypothetical protein